MTIGRPNGNAWIGKPLDLLIPLQLDSSESGDGLCLEADVLQGDARFDDKRVTLSLEPGAGPDAPRVRLRTTRAVEEPVVTVKLTAGCVTKSTRQYVLLADLPEAPPVVASPSRLAPPAAATNEGAASARTPAFVPPVRPSRPARAPGQTTGPTASTAQGEGTPARPPQPRRRVVPVPVAPPAANADDVRKPRAQASKPAAAQAPAPTGEPRSRLQIEALSPEQQAQLPRPGLGSAGTAPALATGPGQAASTPAGRAGTAPVAPGAALAGAGVELTGTTAMAALAAATEQNRRDAERLKELETALATLREQSAQTQRQLLELRGSLAQAEATRFRNPVIYGLLALLALALIGLVLLWRQARQARLAAAWWNGASEEEFAAVATKRALPRHGELADDDEDDDDGPLSAPADVSGLRSAAQGLRVTALPAGVGTSAFHHRADVRPVNAEELFDVQQQSEFFVSLGQHEQAIGVLREHIAANPATSAMSYLDLLGVLQSVGRREDYVAVAREFSQRFNMDVPGFGHFSGGSHGIEQYPDALQRVADKWPSQGTAELVEELVFRKPTSAEECFELPAYQDLLLLYAVARDLSEHEGAWAVPTQVSEKPGAVLPGHAEHPYQQTAPMPYLAEAEMNRNAANAGDVGPLELDLSELDRTAFETLRAPIEPNPAASKPPAAPSIDPHVIDFDPFDPDTNQGDLRPRHLGVKR